MRARDLDGLMQARQGAHLLGAGRSNRTPPARRRRDVPHPKPADTGASVALTQMVRACGTTTGSLLKFVADGQYPKVVVQDDLGVEVELDQRSDGFRLPVSFPPDPFLRTLRVFVSQSTR
jgi:hypothetical protein